MSQDALKKMAAEAAVALVEDGMTLGLGTGSTAAFAVARLGQLVRGGMAVRCIPTSEATRKLAEAEGIPLITFADATHIDLTLDGADEFDPALNLIKGGGGALFREKIVAAASARLVVFADASKQVPTLGAFPLPVEVNPFGWQVCADRIAALGAKVTLRGVGSQPGEAAPFVTDNQGYVLDCAFGAIPNPPALELQLRAITGVTVTGLFCGMTEQVMLAAPDGVTAVHPA